MISRMLWLLTVGALMLPPLDTLLDRSMAGQMTIQIPLLTALGYLAFHIWPGMNLKTPEQAMTVIIFMAGSLIFWMLPRSLDATITVAWIDQVMHANWLIIGWLLASAAARLHFLVRFATGIYVAAMILAAGVIYASAIIPVCSNYSVRQQNIAGTMLILIGLVFFLGVLMRAVIFFRHAAGADREPDEYLSLQQRFRDSPGGP